MGRTKSRQAPRTTMSIRVSERERRHIEEKAMATGLAASAYIRIMALDGGNVDTTIHEDRQKLMHELSAIGNNINQIARILFMPDALNLVLRMYCSSSLR
ncbi:plasmid mobilization protein [Agathobacter sp.]|uniref:plasmid mobilization protein n=1 Tax=Agathobacter sp. TaxID=2021311 RepID=UPI003AB6BF23